MRMFAIAIFASIAFGVGAADAKVVITVDKTTQRMTVTVDGAPRWTWPVSTGRRGHATPSGNFQAFRMEEDHYSKEWDDAPMPHSIFFTRRGHAIHGSFDTRRLGTAASAGCVRLHPDNAKQLFALVKQRGVQNATVIISGDAPASRAVPSVQNQPGHAPPRSTTLDTVDPRLARPTYRQPGYPQPYYRQPAYPQPYYQQPGYYYVPQTAPQGYYYR